jgi:hypothetical protein
VSPLTAEHVDLLKLLSLIPDGHDECVSTFHVS